MLKSATKPRIHPRSDGGKQLSLKDFKAAASCSSSSQGKYSRLNVEASEFVTQKRNSTS